MKNKIFRCSITLNEGLLVAIDKVTGEEKWGFELNNYAWSSPVDVYTNDGKAFIIQADSSGAIHLIKGTTEEVKDVIQLRSNIEASPAVYKSSSCRNSSWIHLRSNTKITKRMIQDR